MILSQTRNGLRLRVYVQPRSSHDRVIGPHGDALRVQVSAPPVDDAANRALVAVLAAWLDVPRRAVTVMHGRTGRTKMVQVVTRVPKELLARIQAAVGGSR